MEINFFFEDVPKITLNKNLTNWINETIENESKTLGEINVIFCSDNYLLNMNKEHLQHNYFTDIITFDYCEENIVSGDLFISVDRVGENAKEYNVDFLNELSRVIVHGVLHLLSYNDKTDEQQKEMTEKENFYLSKLYV